jgi:hypothetical protein
MGRGLAREYEYSVPYLPSISGSPLLIYHSLGQGNILHHDYATPPYIVQLSRPDHHHQNKCTPVYSSIRPCRQQHFVVSHVQQLSSQSQLILSPRMNY